MSLKVTATIVQTIELWEVELCLSPSARFDNSSSSLDPNYHNLITPILIVSISHGTQKQHCNRVPPPSHRHVFPRLHPHVPEILPHQRRARRMLSGNIRPSEKHHNRRTARCLLSKSQLQHPHPTSRPIDHLHPALRIRRRSRAPRPNQPPKIQPIHRLRRDRNEGRYLRA